jgi:hypothetical protein
VLPASAHLSASLANQDSKAATEDALPQLHALQINFNTELYALTHAPSALIK